MATIKKNKIKVWIIALCTLTVLVIAYVNKPYINIAYYYVFKFNHFSQNDKVYISSQYYADANVNAIGAMRLIRPLSKPEINAKQTNPDMQEVLKSSNSVTPNPYVINAGGYFDKDEMKANKSGCMGTFIEYSLVYVQDVSKKNYVPVMLCKIKPNSNIFHHEKSKFNYFIPKSFAIADSAIYVDPFQISNTEPSRI